MKKNQNDLLPNQKSEEDLLSSQTKRVFLFLRNKLTTASDVEEQTGVKQKSITRIKRKLEKEGLLQVICKDSCPVTGYKAMFITTDRNKFIY